MFAQIQMEKRRRFWFQDNSTRKAYLIGVNHGSRRVDLYPKKRPTIWDKSFKVHIVDKLCAFDFIILGIYDPTTIRIPLPS